MADNVLIAHSLLAGQAHHVQVPPAGPCVVVVRLTIPSKSPHSMNTERPSRPLSSLSSSDARSIPVDPTGHAPLLIISLADKMVVANPCPLHEIGPTLESCHMPIHIDSAHRPFLFGTSYWGIARAATCRPPFSSRRLPRQSGEPTSGYLPSVIVTLVPQHSCYRLSPCTRFTLVSQLFPSSSFGRAPATGF